MSIITDDIYNTLLAMKPCGRLNYLTENNYPADTIKQFYNRLNPKPIKERQPRPAKQKPSFIEGAKKILKNPPIFTSVQFDTTGEPTPTFKYKKEWSEITEIEEADDEEEIQEKI